MNQTHVKLIAPMLIIFSLLLMSCGKTTKVRPHQPKLGDLYCTYEVTAKKGGGAIKVGEEVCIYCENPGFVATCDKAFTMEVAPGMTYDLKKISNSCTECDQDIIDALRTYEYDK